MDPFGHSRWEDDIRPKPQQQRRRPLPRNLFAPRPEYSRYGDEQPIHDPGMAFARIGFGLGALVCAVAIILALATFLLCFVWFLAACLWPS